MTNYFKYQKKIYCADTGETCTGYVKYLKSKHWENLRDRLIGDKKVCSACGYVVPVVQLHHMTYDRLGHELDSDLAILCPNCHMIVHDAKNQQTGKKKSAKRKYKGKSKKKLCRNCRSFGYDKKLHQHYCLYHCTHVEKCQRACPNFSTLRYAKWCRKKCPRI